jgi:hypothetical protein
MSATFDVVSNTAAYFGAVRWSARLGWSAADPSRVVIKLRRGAVRSEHVLPRDLLRAGLEGDRWHVAARVRPFDGPDRGLTEITPTTGGPFVVPSGALLRFLTRIEQSTRIEESTTALCTGTDSGASGPIRITAAYDVADPFTVRFRFGQDSDVEVWDVDREVVAAGLGQDTGLGDLRFRPHPTLLTQVEMRMQTNEGWATIVFSGPWLTGFLSRVFRAVPIGAEAATVDAALDASLSSWLADAPSAHACRRCPERAS